MSTPRHKQLCSLSLSLLLLLPAMPALAQSPAVEREFDLGLEALDLEAATLGDESTAGAEPADRAASSDAAPTVRLAATELPSSPEISRQRADRTRLAEMAKPKKRGGFGRWLKKHWYVPVLAAAAVGVSVSGGGDDDRGGEDD